MDKVPELRKSFLDGHDKDLYDPQDISRVESDDQFVLQFLNGRQGNLDKAQEAMIECLKWRKSFGINGLTESDISEEILQSGVMFFTPGKDKKGATLAFNVVAKYIWKGNEAKSADYLKLMALMCEKFQREHPGEKITFVQECKGSGLANANLDNGRFFVHLAQYCYPDLFENIYLLNFPWIFKALWTILKALLYSYYASKFIFPGEIELLDYIDKDQLPIQFGGESTFEYKYVSEVKIP